MKFGSKLATLLGCIVLAGSAFAVDDICPGIDDIKKEGLLLVQEIHRDTFAAIEYSTFNMDTYWAFALVPVVAESEESARSIANDLLGSMTSPGLAHHYPDVLVCTYETGNPDVFAAAVKNGFPVPVQQLEHFIKTSR